MNPEIPKQELANIVRNKKREVYSFAIFTLVIVLFLLVFAIKPTIETIIRVNSEIREKNTLAEMLSQKITDISDIQKDYDEIEPDVENMKLVFPNRGDFSLYVANVAELCKQNNFDLISINFSEFSDQQPETFTVLKPWSSVVVVKGPSSKVYDLLSSLEALPMYPMVYRVDFANKSGEDGNITYSVTLVVHHIDDPLFYTEL